MASLISPTNIYVNSNNPFFVWSDESAKGSTTNVIEISTTSNFASIISSATGDNTFTSWNTPALGTAQYYWRVLTLKGSTVTWYTSSFAGVYVDVNVPTPVTLLDPVGSTYFTNNNMNFIWTPGSDVGSGITNYTVYISNANTGSNTVITTIGEGVYTWYVENNDYANNTGVSSTNTFTIDVTAPGVVGLTTPVNNTLTNTNNIAFIWGAVADALSGVSNYQISIVGPGLNTNYYTTNLGIGLMGLNNGTNKWQVRAQDKAGNFGLWSSTNYLIVDLNDPTIVLNGPTDMSGSQTNSVTFRWLGSDVGTGVTNYRLFVTNNAGFSSNVIVTSTNYTINNIALGTNYWRVWVADRAGNTNTSPLWSVIVDTNAPYVTLYSPTNVYVTTSTPNFDWSDESLLGVVSNLIQIATNTNFTSITISQTGDNTFTNWTSGALATDQYFWRILTYKASTVTWFTSAYSSVFVDTSIPPVVATIGPTNNMLTNNTSVPFVWNSVTDTGSGVTNYLIMVTNTLGWSTN
jgi:hypothetical protein